MTNLFCSARLRFAPFTLDDAADVYVCITPEITRFMRWEPPTSFEEFWNRRSAVLQAEDQPDRSFVIRHLTTLECLGVAAVEGLSCPVPEIGLWLKADAHRCGYGFEVVQTITDWATFTLGSTGFDYPVAVQNVASRRIAERLGGWITGERHNEKYTSVVYRLPPSASKSIDIPDSD